MLFVGFKGKALQGFLWVGWRVGFGSMQSGDVQFDTVLGGVDGRVIVRPRSFAGPCRCQVGLDVNMALSGFLWVLLCLEPSSAEALDPSPWIPRAERPSSRTMALGGAELGSAAADLVWSLIQDSLVLVQSHQRIERRVLVVVVVVMVVVVVSWCRGVVV